MTLRICAVLAALTLSPRLSAQQVIQPEGRVDAIIARANTYHLGAGASTPLGNYIRVSLVAGGGVTTFRGESAASGRVDVVGRFLIDPFRQQKYGSYAGAGVSVRAVRGQTGRAYLVATLGVEGPPGRFVVPAVELGLGGGTRVGVVLRRSRPQHR